MGADAVFKRWTTKGEGVMSSGLIPLHSSHTALERKYIKRILQYNPGLGDKSALMAESLADSGLPASAAAMILQAVYSPTTGDGKGQGTRAKWFVEAIRYRYGSRPCSENLNRPGAPLKSRAKS